ncbi:thiol reductant ABC exporter subunit CydD [Nocardioides acrostichi]|uniref:Thiol reductant ABC exporter subunit CydD n=1 Tax=Nocardioides acrostichi TaxID=2784339 RepID=A0A930V0Z2_9ACTN|nr:thiol reductant ABC exporter subunit CydD [Nocardioides acrostichi]MBF4161715.1 thiol reductant ABC exporter subunit CydD [Nocardioides acrostichi]
MKPVDPRAVRRLRPAAVPLAGVLGGNVAGGLLVVAQAFAVAALVVDVVEGRAWRSAALAVVLVGVGRGLVTLLVDSCAQAAAGRVSLGLRGEVMAAAGRSSGVRPDDLTLLATRGVAAAEPYVTRYLPAFATALVLPVLIVLAVASQDVWSALVLVLTLPLVPLFAALVGLRTQDSADRQWHALSLLSGHFLDLVRGLPTLVAYGRAEGQGARVRAITERYRRASAETLRLGFASGAVLELVATLSVAVVAVTVGLRLAAGSVGLGTALVVLLLAPEAFWPWRRVGAEFHAAAEGVATFASIDALSSSLSPWGWTPAPDPSVHRQGVGDPERLASPAIDPVPIVLDDVRVTYPGRTTPALVLDHAVVPPTGITAVVGASGSGKSTLLAHLIDRLDPRLLAQVPQRPWILPGTVGENVSLGRPDASEPEILAALDAVELPVDSLPDGLATRLGDDGLGLSAGQAARLALARVVLARRPYVLLDEPTAHLDDDTEAVLLRTLRRLATTATVIVVAHRPAVVEAADHVIALEVPDAGPGAASAGAVRLAESAPEAEEAPEPASRFWLSVLLGSGSALAGIALTATAGWLIARSAQHPEVLTLLVAIVGVRTFGIARPALRYAERIVSHDHALLLLARRRAEVYAALVPLVPARLGRRRGDLLAGIVDDVDAVVDERLRVRLPVWTSLVTGLVTAGILVPISWRAAVAALVVVLVALVAAGLARWATARAERGFVHARADLGTEVETAVAAARQLRLWQADDAARRRVDARGRSLAAHAATSARGAALARAVVVVAGLAGVAASGAALHEQAGTIGGPVAALLLLVPLALAEAMAPVVDAAVVSVRTRAARERLDALAATTPAVAEPVTPARVADARPLALHRVATGWGERDVLVDVSLGLEAGETLVVTGPSGCGKSTLAALLAAQVPVRSGTYTLAGAASSDLGPAEVRRHVLLADAEPHVFATSVRENLRLARPGCADDVIVDALARAGLEGWMAGLPAGLDTLLAGDGSLSGGERARLGAARAFLAEPDVLVLDEPTAHLDRATADALADAVLADGARHERALVWVGHDATTLKLGREDPARILVLGEARPRASRRPAARA